MTSEPKRWLDGGDELSELEQRVLSAAPQLPAPSGLERTVLERVRARLHDEAQASSARQWLASSAPARWKLRKRRLAVAVALAAVLSSALAAGALLVARARSRVAVMSQRPSPPGSAQRSPPAPSQAAASNGAPDNGQRSTPDADSPPAVADVAADKRPRPAAVHPSAQPAEDAALAESKAVAEARALLRGGSPAQAVERLEHIRVAFPHGLLAQEREALTIEALASAGQKEAASERANAFLARYPTSPHAAAVRRALR